MLIQTTVPEFGVSCYLTRVTNRPKRDTDVSWFPPLSPIPYPTGCVVSVNLSRETEDRRRPLCHVIKG